MGKEQELIEAARSGNLAVVERILSQRAKRSGPLASLRRGPGANAQDQSGYTSLHHSALNGHKDIVLLLLQYEASTNVVDHKGSTPLHLAAWTGNTDIVRILLEQGPSQPNVNLANHDRETALHSAAQYGHRDVVSMLLQHESEPSVRNLKEESPLDLAAQYGRLESVEILVSKHPELLRNFVKRHTPLHLAARNGHRQVAKVLLDGGFNVNTVVENGSALHEAALYGKMEVVKLLLDRGIDVALRDHQNRTVFDLLEDLNTSIAKQTAKLIRDHLASHQLNIKAAKSPQQISPASLSADVAFPKTSSREEDEPVSQESSPDQRSLCSPCEMSKDDLLQDTPFSDPVGNRISGSRPAPPLKPPRKSVTSLSPGGRSARYSSAAVDYFYFSDSEGGRGGHTTPDDEERITNGKVTESSPFSTLYDDIASGKWQDHAPRRRVENGDVVKPNSLDFRSKRATIQIPLSPTNYQQPPTPDFPPPSPATAATGIHEKIRPLSQEYRDKRMSRDIETLTEEELFATIDRNGKIEVMMERKNKSVSTDNIEEVIDDNPFAGLCRGSSVCSGTCACGKPQIPPKPPPSSYEVKSLNRKRRDETKVERRAVSSLISPDGGVFAQEMEEQFMRTMSQLRKEFKKSSLNKGFNSVEEWLSNIGLSDFSKAFVKSGFDDIDFMGGNILEEEDLVAMGILEKQKRLSILDSAKGLKAVPQIGDKEESVEEWLKALRLTPYTQVFLRNGYVDMARVRKLWDIELKTVLEVNKVGHRKRILASLGEKTTSRFFEDLKEFNLSKMKLGFSELDSGEETKTVNILQEHSNSKPAPLSANGTPTSIDAKTLKIRPPTQLMSGPNTLKSPLIQDSPFFPAAAQWRHQPEMLVKGSCNYTTKYLGSTLVKELRGLDSTRKSILKLKGSTRDSGKVPNVILSISHSGVKFIDAQAKKLVCEHEIRNIHCACQDAEDRIYFAYITKEHQTMNHYCHVFCAQNVEMATEIILTLGQAFEVAYQMALQENKSPNAEEDPDKEKKYQITVHLVQKTPEKRPKDFS